MKNRNEHTYRKTSINFRGSRGGLNRWGLNRRGLIREGGLFKKLKVKDTTNNFVSALFFWILSSDAKIYNKAAA